MEHLYVITQSKGGGDFTKRLTASSHLGLIKRRDLKHSILDATLECNVFYCYCG